MSWSVCRPWHRERCAGDAGRGFRSGKAGEQGGKKSGGVLSGRWSSWAVCPPRLINDDDGMGTCRDLGADFVEMQVHGFGIGRGEKQSRWPAGFRPGCGERLGGLVALTLGVPRPAAPACPPAGRLAFLTDPGFLRRTASIHEGLRFRLGENSAAGQVPGKEYLANSSYDRFQDRKPASYLDIA